MRSVSMRTGSVKLLIFCVLLFKDFNTMLSKVILSRTMRGLNSIRLFMPIECWKPTKEESKVPGARRLTGKLRSKSFANSYKK